MRETACGKGRVTPLEEGLTLGPARLQGVRMRFARNEEIFGAGEAAEYVYRVVSGTVRTMRFTVDGRRQILAFHMPGDVFGLDAAGTHASSAEAICDCALVLVRRASVEKAADDDVAAARALLKLTREQMRKAQEHALVLGLKGANERVGAFLSQLAERFAESGEIELPMSRADIADHLALTIETVSRAFTQMEREHTIDLPSTRHVVMRSPAALARPRAA